MLEQLKAIREAFEATQLKRECRRLPNGDYENSFVNSAWRYFQAGVGAANDMAKGQKPVAWLCIVNTADAGPTKFFTAPSDPRGFPVFAAPVAQQPQAEAVPIGVVVAIDASDPENGPDAVVALHRDVALGAKLYDHPPSRSAEIAELKESLRISLENYETQRKAAGQARAAMYDIHYALKDAGWHPGRTDDKLADIIRAKGERMRELEADSAIKLTQEEIEALRHTMSSAVLFSRAKNISDIRSSVLTRFDQFFEHVKDHVRPHQPDPEAVAEGLAQIIFEAINPGKVWTYQSTDVRNAYWSAGQAAKEFLK